MSAVGQVVTVTTAATLVFEVVDAVTYAGLTSPAANIFKAREPSDPLPLYIAIPTGSTVVFGGSTVTASDGNVGCTIVGPNVLVYNVTASDSLYAIVASSTATLGLLAMRQ